MKAVLLAAGDGTRLWPITETRPKPLIPILCKPIIEWHINALLDIDIEEIIIVVNYMKDQIIKYVSEKYSDRRIRFIDQVYSRGTGDAVIKASWDLGFGEDILVLYSDIFVDNWGILKNIMQEESSVIVGTVVDDPGNYGTIYTDGVYLNRIIEKPEKPESNIINAGIYKLNTSDILENRDIPLSPRGELELTDIVNKIASKKKVKTYIYRDKWIDVGRPWNVIEANKAALSKIEHSIKGKVIEPVHIEKPIYIEEDSTIYPHTALKGPVYIDKKVELGPNAYIRPWSVICSGSKIGFSVEVKESIIFENVHASHIAYIGDSIICENVNLGAGTMLANLRFDRKTVKTPVKGVVEDTGRRKLGAVIGASTQTGVNVSIMPGVKIGSNSWILPGTVVYRDVPSNTIYPPIA